MDEHCLFIDDLHRGKLVIFPHLVGLQEAIWFYAPPWTPNFLRDPKARNAGKDDDDDDDQSQGSDRNAGAFTPIRTTWQVWQVWLPISSDPSAIISHRKKSSRRINTECETMKHVAWHFSSRGDPFQRDAPGSPET